MSATTTQIMPPPLPTQRKEDKATGMNTPTEHSPVANNNEAQPNFDRLDSDLFRLLIESVSDYAIFLLDPEGYVKTWNIGTKRIKGYDADEIIGQHFSCFYTDEDRQQGMPVQELKIASSKDQFEDEGWRVRKDGSKLWASVVITALRDDSGELIGFAKITRDLTERKKSEVAIKARSEELARLVRDRAAELITVNQKLQVSESWFRQAIEEAPFPILLHAEDDSILSVNRAWGELTGYTLKQLPKLSDWIERACGNKEQARAAANRIFTLGKGRLDHGEFIVITAKGEELIWDFSSSVLGKLPGGRVLAISMAKDITKRKRAEEALIRLNTAVEAAANGIVIVDREGVILWVNPAFTRITGYPKDEAVGQHTRILNSGIHDQKFYHDLWSTVIAGRVWRGVLCNRRKDGSHYYEEMTITPVMGDHGNVLQFVAIKEDITDKHHLQSQLQQAQKMEAVGQLAGGVAHDFNNLLTIISGYSEILLTTIPATDPKREMVKAVSVAGERAAGLTRQLLAFSRQTVLEPKVLDLNAVVKDTEKMLRRLIGEDVLLTTTIDPQTRLVKVDSTQLGQVLMNLAVNARDAMPKGGNLTIETANVDLDASYTKTHEGVKPGRYVLLAVTDSGAGMPPEVKSRIFEPFFTTKGVGKGTGLGLAVVMGIVQQSGGHLEVYSEVGLGTTFKIYFPAVTDEVVDEAAPTSAGLLHGTETICLVEDEDSVREMARLVFQTHGYTVLHASGGKEALRLLDQHKGQVAILVTDVVMPYMSGRDLADSLLTKFPHIKVLFTSGYTDDAIVRHGILQAEVAFLQKPYTPMSLLRKVRQVLDQK